MTLGTKFGQHEPLTTRLHNLVRSYPKGLGILKEFIQNADDAEADEITFIIDERQYETTGLPESMRWLHKTPALLVYNNKAFSEDDLNGIQRIGESGKSQSVGKTGRFGLGFNACYNVTDVPCFFTRGRLFFFDPHYQTIPGAAIDSPGRCFSVEDIEGVNWPIFQSLTSVIESAKTFAGTVFRLPFRTEDQKEHSRIKKDAYTVENVFESVQELADMGSAMLIFLKHVRRIRVERYASNGQKSLLLSMESVNADEIAAARAKVNELLSVKDTGQLLDELEHLNCAFSKCKHEYKIITYGFEHTDAWVVIDGFFVDQQKTVLQACRNMIANEEKALPYAGAAYKIRYTQRERGRLFCFLPVPVQTSIPVQLNGYFDLDDSRQNMFLDSTAQGSARMRVAWNRKLLETSVTQAYVELVGMLRDNLPNNDMGAYYDAFPLARPKDSGWENWLTTAFYLMASQGCLYRVSGPKSWVTLQETKSLPDSLAKIGSYLIQEGFLTILTPGLPSHVTTGFERNGISVPQLAPQDLRKALSLSADVNCPLQDAPRVCLRTREVIIQMLTFCISDGPIRALTGLPLFVDCRGYLRTLGLTEKELFIAGNSFDHEVFIHNPDWFIEPELVVEAQLDKVRDVALRTMDSKWFLQKLHGYVSALGDVNCLTLNSGYSGLLSDAWLQSVFNRLLATDTAGQNVEILRQTPLIPDQSGLLHPLGLMSTPLLFRGSLDFKQALAEIGVPLVDNVSKTLFELLFKFAETKGHIWKVTPCDLADTLDDACDETLKSFQLVSNVQRALLDFFCREEYLSELGKHQAQLEKLKRLHFYPTSAGTVVNLDRKVYISQDFRFPSVSFDVTLLDDGANHKWRALYQLLKVPELSRARLIRDVLLPGLESLDRSAHYDATAWLRDHLSVAQSEETQVDSKALFALVRDTPFIVCEDNEMRAPCCVYQPDSNVAKAIFGDKTALPDMQLTYAKESDRWLEFFRQMGMPTEPRLEDVFAYVSNISEAEPSAVNAECLQSVYDFLRSKVENQLRETKELPANFRSIVERLSSLEWIPVRQTPGDLLCFKAPNRPYFRPCDVFFPRVGQLVASQAAIAALKTEPNKRVREVLGFPVKPTLNLVVSHFKEVLFACSSESEKPNDAALLKTLSQIYKFFGGEAPKEVDDQDEDLVGQNQEDARRLQADFINIPCIWDKEYKRFWRPDQVFSDNVQYMEPWRRTIRSDGAVERAYAAFGRRDAATTEDWKRVLCEIAESGESVSRYETRSVIRALLQRIVEDLSNTESRDATVLVPTRDNRLLPARSVFFDDAPWYDDLVETADIPILDSLVSGIFRIQSVLEIPSLANSLTQNLTEETVPSDKQRELEECTRLQSNVRSDAFRAGLTRLLRHENSEAMIEDLTYLSVLNISCVKAIRTCVSVRVDGEIRLLGDYEADSFFDDNGFTAILVEKRKRYFCDDLSSLINRALGGQPLKNLAPLVHIVDCDPSEIDCVLDDLKIRRIDVDEQYETEDEVPALQEYPEEDRNDASDTDAQAESNTIELGNKGSTAINEAQVVADGQDENGNLTESTDELSVTTMNRVPAHAVMRGENRTESKGVSARSGADNSIGTGRRTQRSPAPRTDMERVDQPDADATASKPDKSTASKPSAATQRRLVSYVVSVSGTSNARTASDKEEDASIRIGDAAVKHVIEYESRRGRAAKSMAQTNPGYDVVSEGGGAARYIEVKGTQFTWGELGVGLTPTQLHYSADNQDRDFWLYVVENVFTDKPTIYEIHNPKEKIGRFMFDGGWKQIADRAETLEISVSKKSVVGSKIVLNGNVVGVVEEVKSFGRFEMVIYRDASGAKQRKRLSEVEIEEVM